MRHDKEVKDWNWDELQAWCSETIVDTFLREGIRNFKGVWPIIFNVYDQWREAQNKLKSKKTL